MPLTMMCPLSFSNAAYVQLALFVTYFPTPRLREHVHTFNRAPTKGQST